MATCKLKYIEDNNSLNESQKEELTDIHFGIMSDLLSSQSESGSKLFTEVKLASGKKVVFLTSKKNSSSLHAQQLERISEINTAYNTYITSRGFTGTGNQKVIDVKSVKLSTNSKEPHDILAVNLLNFIPTGYTPEEIDDMVAEVALDIETETFENGMIDTDYDILSQVSERKDAVLEQLDVLLNKADAYITNVINNKNADGRLFYLDSSIKSLYWSIKNATDDVSKMANILEYMSKANSITTRLANSIKNTTKRIKSLNKDSSNYDQEISNIATFLSESEQIMAFLSPFTNIVEGIDKDKKTLFWSKYNLHKVVKDFKSLAGYDPRLITNLETVLKNKITNKEELLEYLQVALERTDKEILRKELEDILTEATIEKSKTDAFEEIAANIRRMQTELKNDYYDFLSTVLYNQQLNIHRVNSADEITDPKKLSRFEEKQTIKKKLQIADSDIRLTNMLLASGYDVKDSITKLITGVIDDHIRLGKLNNQNLTLTYEEEIENIISRADEAKRKSWDSAIVKKIKTIDKEASLIEADENYTGPTYTRFGKTFKVRETNAITTNVDRARFNLDSRIHKATYEERAEKIVKILEDSDPAKILTDDVVSKIDPEDFKYLLSSKMLVYSPDRRGFMIAQALGELEIKLYYGFYNYHVKVKKDEDINNILFDLYIGNKKEKSNYDEAVEKQLFTTEAMIAELNRGTESNFFRRLFHKESLKTHRLRESRVIFQDERKKLFGNSQGGVMLRSPEGKMVFIEVPANVANITLNEEYADYSYFSLAEQFTTIEEYGNPNYQTLASLFASDPKAEAYYKLMIKKYTEANDKYAGNRFKYGELPRISTDKTDTFWETVTSKEKSLKAVSEWFKDFRYKDSNVRIKYGWDEDGNRVFVDKDGNPTNTPFYVQLVDTYGDPLREVVPGHTKYLSPEQEQETDLKVSMFMFNFSANEYEAAVTASDIVPVIKTIIKGSKSLEINAREAQKKDKNNNFLLATGNRIATKESTRIAEALFNTIDTIVYGTPQEDTKLLGLSGKVISRRIKGLMAWTQLALNIKAALTNTSFGTVSNYLIGASRQFGLSEREIRIAYGEYRKNAISFAADMRKSKLSETSLMTQLASYFDAQKGDREDGRTSIDRKDPVKSGILGLLFSTSTMPEHLNQIVLMKALFNSYKILSIDGKDYTMKDFVSHQKGKAFTFDYNKLEALGIDKETWNKKIIQFIKVVTSANQDAHGQYDVLRKSVIQQRDLLSLGWVYSKWIYPGWKNRFRDEEFSYQTGEIANEGYLKTHFKFLMKDAVDMNANWEKVSFLSEFWNYAKSNKAKTAGIIASSVGKQAAGVFDTLTGRVFSKNNKTFSEWIYGNEDIAEQAKIAILRANLEISMFAGALLLGLVAHALADDEEEDTFAYFMLKQTELQSKRLANDLGLYLLYTDPSYAKNKIRDKLKDPFVVGKIFDNNASLFVSVFGVSDDPEDGFGFAINDKYQRSGPGYEKGDYKVVRKLEKSVFSPIYQLSTFLEPEQSLKFMDMLNRK